MDIARDQIVTRLHIVMRVYHGIFQYKIIVRATTQVGIIILAQGTAIHNQHPV